MAPKTHPEPVVQFSLAEALRLGPPPSGNLAVPIFDRGSLNVELYQPQGHDPQQPHSRDELYFVAQGAGRFFDGMHYKDVAAGSFIFVPAATPHRFESFSKDFAVWVVFFGSDTRKSDPNA